MVRGTLQVLLVSAKGLQDNDYLGKMDPYAIVICRSQEHKSSTATGAGSVPEWNENFVFTVSDTIKELTIKLMDRDAFSSDDFLGEAKIPLEPVFAEGNLPPTTYNVVKDQKYCGEIKIGLTFTPSEMLNISRRFKLPIRYLDLVQLASENRSLDIEEEYGGWKHSAH